MGNARTVTELHSLEDKLDEVEKTISEECHLKQAEKNTNHLKSITDPDGKVNSNGVWRLRRKVCPNPLEQLTAKKDKEGNITTNPETIKEIYLEAYVDRLKHREMDPKLEDLKTLRERLFEQRLSAAKKVKSPPWTMEELEKVLSKLKNGKAADPTGLVNELFMLENIGDDLKKSILMLLNKIKDQLKDPEFMNMANITSFWKAFC